MSEAWVKFRIDHKDKKSPYKLDLCFRESKKVISVPVSKNKWVRVSNSSQAVS